MLFAVAAYMTGRRSAQCRLGACLSFFLLVAGSALAENREPLRFKDQIEVDGLALALPSELFLKPRDGDLIEVRLAGNLGQLQRALPGMLNGVIYEDCESLILLDIRSTQASSDQLHVSGLVQVTLFECASRAENRRGIELFSNTADVKLTVEASMRGNCLQTEIDDISIEPRGLLGQLANLAGVTSSITEEARRELKEAINSEENCLDLPEPLRIVETTIESGGFRDFGGGALGFVIKGTVKSTPEELIDLIYWADREELLEDGCSCE